MIEQHHPTAQLIRQNVTNLGVESRAEVIAGNTFLWWKKRAALPDSMPWAVFCSPPYDFYVDRNAEMLELIGEMIDAAPAESLAVVEADARFDFQTLPFPADWDVRSYPPAVVGIYQKA